MIKLFRPNTAKIPKFDKRKDDERAKYKTINIFSILIGTKYKSP